MTRTTHLIKVLANLVRVSLSYLDVDRVVKSEIKYRNQMADMIRHEGKAQTCVFYKLLHTCAIKVATQDVLPDIRFRKRTKEGIPVALKPVLWLLQSPDPELKRLGLTITRSYERIRLKPDYSVSNIVMDGPEIDPDLLKDFDIFCKKWTMRINANSLRTRPQDKVLGNLVQGPNGPSIATSHYDACGVQSNDILHRSLTRLAALTGNGWIMDMMRSIRSKVPFDNFLTGRIAFLTEGGGKTRVIAIGDYWSQNVLRPLHDKLMSVLRTLVTDGTWDQNAQVKRILRECKEPAYSYDLSAATDRFPLILQKILLSHVFSKEIAENWASALTHRAFSTPQGEVSWKVGQPLGMLSSWAAFSLTHHAITEYIAFKKGNNSFRKYAIVGDDIVIWDSKVATSYKEFMERIGVNINMTKTLVGDDRNQRIEFCKRILFNGTEITGLKPTLLDACARSIYMFPDLLRVTTERGWNLPWAEIEAPSFLSSKGKEFLAILIAEQINLVPHYWVTLDVNRTISLEALSKETLKVRIASLLRKRDSVQNALMAAKPLNELFAGEGIDVSEHLLGNLGYIPYPHPIVWAINQHGEDLVMALSILESTIDGSTEPPEVMPVEFIPIPSTLAFFGARQEHKTRYHSRMVLQAWSNLLTTESPKG